MRQLAISTAIWIVLGVVGIYWYEGGLRSYRYPGYVPIACFEHVAPGETFVQREVTEEERQILMGDDVFDIAGYVRTRARYGYLRLIDSALAESRRVARRRMEPEVELQARRCGGPDREVIGTIPEFPGRWSAIYALDGGASRMLLARTDFWSYNGGSARYDLTYNFLINGEPAVVVLTRNHDNGPALWDIGWDRDGVGFELTVEDTVANDKPQRYTASQLIQLAESIDRACHWLREKLPDNDFPPNTVISFPG